MSRERDALLSSFCHRLLRAAWLLVSRFLSAVVVAGLLPVTAQATRTVANNLGDDTAALRAVVAQAQALGGNVAIQDVS